MSKDDSGLLSKVVKFVRNPTTNWADLDQQETDRESSYSKQMLKEMIERKRRNDFVRKREFDMLRKMRRSEVMAGQDPMARPSFFQSSMPSKPDDRATTLKKIDEIEAQMSMQWWKTKHGDSSLRSTSGALPGSAHAPIENARVPLPPNRTNSYTRTAPQPLEPLASPAPTETPPMLGSVTPGAMPPARPDAPVTPAAPAPGRAGPASRPAPQRPISAVTPNKGDSLPSSNSNSVFSASKLIAIDVDEFAHDPELEEAAIRFANGDDAGAEAGLMEVLAPTGTRINHDETWLTLFDLYRATGQLDRYEAAAIEFAGRFARSAPQWVSLPDAVSRMNAPPAGTPTPNQQIADWTSPASFGTQTLAALNAALAKAPQPWRLNWNKLTTIEEVALEGLAKLFTQWASQPVQLRFIGAGNLENVLRNGTPSGDKTANPAWWRLRMEMLRVTHQPDEFELVALDYCVTYEVSPPSWESARTEFKPLQNDGSYISGHTIIGDAFHDSMATGAMTMVGDSQIPQISNVSTVELAGQILGDAAEALATLDAKLAGADIMIISCDRLIRIDFSAAGTLLNWVSSRQAEGRQVQFVHVHRLVAGFFNVIGISEHARVIARTD
ncbi:STAS domain-containing protein [Caenimonas terrae]|uniref:STAS domain-containing protein n=1 Tax=Caenimonas terrae TaxID=696074 RepID=A0ABW0NFC1_9BURK